MKKIKMQIDWLSKERFAPDKWESQTRLNVENALEYGRSPFLHDIGTILHLQDFRKLADITQVYSNPSNYVRSRLTHSLEVANIAIQIGRAFRIAVLNRWKGTLKSNHNEFNNILTESDDVTFAACIAHDIGHPPFAHTGEKTIREMEQIDSGFDSNVNNLRILSGISPVSKLNRVYLTAAVLDGVIKKKHMDPYGSKNYVLSDEIDLVKKISQSNGTKIKTESRLSHNSFAYAAEDISNLKRTLPDELFLRSPISHIMEAADDISYITSDIEDALRLGNLDVSSLINLVEGLNEKYPLDSQYNSLSIEGKLMSWGDFIKEKDYKGQITSIKAALIRFFLKECINALKDLIPPNIGQTSAIEFMNDLPVHLYLHSIRNSLKDNKEFGNILYFGGKGQKIYDFKGKIYDELLNTRKVAEDNADSKRIIASIYRYLIPKGPKNFREIALKNASFMPKEYVIEVKSL